MMVELVDKDQNIPSLGLPNGTWFAVLNIPGVETLGWFSDIGAEKGKEYLIDFFRNCKGFRTH